MNKSLTHVQNSLVAKVTLQLEKELRTLIWNVKLFLKQKKADAGI